MTQQHNKKKLGFTLMEISISLIILTILAGGIIGGRSIVNRSRFSLARSLTTNSPVTGTKNLVVWYEPVLVTSFNSTDTIDGKPLSNSNGVSWFNNAPSKDNHAIIGTVAPSYVTSSINSLPAVRFSGANGNFLAFSTADLNQKYYTAFIVERRASAATMRHLYLGQSVAIGYNNSTTLSGTNIANNFTVPSYNAPIPRILTFLTGKQNDYTRGIFINGGSSSGTGNGSTPSVTTADNMLSSSSIGRIGSNSSGSANYNGDIAEIIIFNRTLNITERNDIQEYLGKKYGIKVIKSI